MFLRKTPTKWVPYKAHKQQAASSKQQAASSKQQAASSKQQAASSKQQAASSDVRKIMMIYPYNPRLDTTSQL
ncbi:hypothetical protein [Aeromonas salmonicida]